MKKRLLSLLLAVCLSLSLALPATAASKFSDLSGHWAQTYMETLAAKGYLAGYSNGTMMPDTNITTCQALVILSNFYAVSDDMKTWISADYKSTVTTRVPSSLSWAYDQIMVCLAAGIITQTQLATLDLTAKIQKQDLAMFIVKALQLTNVAAVADTSKLTFTDVSSITTGYAGYISALVDAGITGGNSKNQFSPKSNVTRAVVATMIYQAMDYVDQKKLTLAITAYDGYAAASGIITAATSTSVTLQDYKGVTRRYTVPATASVKVDSSAKALSGIYIGCLAELTAKSGAVVSLSITSASTATWLQGVITNVSTTSYGNVLYFTPTGSASASHYAASDSASVTISGTKSTFSSLAKGDFVSIKLVNKAITEVISYPCAYTLTGTITTLNYGATVTLEIKDADGYTVCYALDITKLPTITRGTSTISIDRLNVGTEVTVTVKNGAISSISTNASANTVKGELTSITSTTAGTTWVITDTSNVPHSLTLDSGVSAYDGAGKSVLLSVIQVGDTVSVEVYSNTITEVSLQSAAVSSTQLVGTVLVVDATAKQLTVLISGKLIYIDTSAVTYIINLSTGKSMSLASVTVDSTLTAYGAYTDATHFAATSILVSA